MPADPRQRRTPARSASARASWHHWTMIEVRKIAGALGAEIGNVDLSHPMSAAVVASIRAAWLEHLVIFFHDQVLTPAQFLRFARTLGEPMEYPLLKGLAEFPEITSTVKTPLLFVRAEISSPL